MNSFAFDRLSFWLGFFAASLLWLLIDRIRAIWPKIIIWLKDRMEKLREDRLRGIEIALRQETVRRAQKNHLASSLFSLDEILITPKLLCPEQPIDTENALPFERTIHQVFPSLYDWPEIPSQFGGPFLSLPQSIINGSNILIVGQPGCGKSTALAYFATIIARQDSAANELAHKFPIYLHIQDLDLSNTETDPVACLIKHYTKITPTAYQRQLNIFFRGLFETKDAVFLLDGLDELTISELAIATGYLKGLMNNYPGIPVVATGYPDYVDGLLSLGFTPLPLAGWNHNEVKQFITNWGKLWTKLIGANQPINTQNPNLDLLISNWLFIDNLMLTPIEWTMRVWGAYSGDLSGTLPTHAIEAYLNRATQSKISPQILSTLPALLASKNTSIISYIDAEKSLSKFKIPSFSGQTEDSPDEIKDQQIALTSQGKLKTKKVKQLTSGEKIISILLSEGILTEHPGEKLRFTSPVISGYLFSFASDTPLPIPEHPINQIYNLRIKYSLAQNHTIDWLEPYLQSDHSPLFSNLLNAARWMTAIPSNIPAKAQIMRQIAAKLQDDAISPGIRARLISACILSNDPSMSLLYRQLLNSSSAIVRKLAIIGLGAARETKSITTILSAVNDRNPEVRYAAALSLVTNETKVAKDAVVQILQTGDESVRLACAEGLACQPAFGHDLLREMLSSDDILVRRSVVFGLSLIHEPWSVQLLEKCAVEDGQWVVRNVAGQALEMHQKAANPYIPTPAQDPLKTPWIYEYAANQGEGISIETSISDLLVQILNNGTPEEKRKALYLARNYPDGKVIPAIYAILFSPQADLHDTALITLKWVKSAGIDLPAPRQFGYN